MSLRGIESATAINWAEKVPLGKTRQWVFARGSDVRNPVLLILAGGPGGTETGWFRRYNAALEEHFTVVHWEQQGAGKSFRLLFTDGRHMTPQQYVADGLVLTDYLRTRFGQQKIYLMGHSWGTFLGVWMVQQRPEWYAAYVGIGQMVCPAVNDRMQYEWTLGRARKLGETKIVKKLERNGPPPYGGGAVRVAKKYADITLPNFRYMWADMLAAGGHPAGGDIKAMINVDEYGLLNKVGAIAGVALTFGRVYPQLHNVDLAARADRLDVPVFFAEGRHDANAMPILVERYCELLQAPHKELVWFERSAHNPCFEEADRFNSFMIDTVLARAQDHSSRPVPV